MNYMETPQPPEKGIRRLSNREYGRLKDWMRTKEALVETHSNDEIAAIASAAIDADVSPYTIVEVLDDLEFVRKPKAVNADLAARLIDIEARLRALESRTPLLQSIPTLVGAH